MRQFAHQYAHFVPRGTVNKISKPYFKIGVCGKVIPQKKDAVDKGEQQGFFNQDVPVHAWQVSVHQSFF